MLFNNKKADEDHATADFSARRASAAISVLHADAAPGSARKAGGAPTRSVIDAWLTITGDLLSEGEVQIDGQVRGDIRCSQLIVGQDATIAGNIIAEEVVVRGKVKGTIRANRVLLQDSARVESEIIHKKLAIEEGASFEGMSRRVDDPMKGVEGKPALQAVAAE